MDANAAVTAANASAATDVFPTADAPLPTAAAIDVFPIPSAAALSHAEEPTAAKSLQSDSNEDAITNAAADAHP